MVKETKKLRLVKVIEDYNPDSELFVDIKKDEIVTYITDHVDNLDWKNWIECKYKGKTCYIPKQYLYKIDNHYYLNRDYDSTELTVTKGMILVFEFELNGFAYGNLQGTNKKGWVPLSSLEMK